MFRQDHLACGTCAGDRGAQGQARSRSSWAFALPPHAATTSQYLQVLRRAGHAVGWGAPRRTDERCPATAVPGPRLRAGAEWARRAAPPAAGQPSGVLMASPRTVSGRASAERGRGRSKRAYFGGGRLTGFCRDSDRPHATRPGPPAAAAHHRQSGDPDRIPAARRAQRPAHGRPLRESDRHHRAPGISRSWQQNGRIPAQ